MPLITHVFDIGDAEKRNEIVLGKIKEPTYWVFIKIRKFRWEHKTYVQLMNDPIAEINTGFMGSSSHRVINPNCQIMGSFLDACSNLPRNNFKECV